MSDDYTSDEMPQNLGWKALLGLTPIDDADKEELQAIQSQAGEEITGTRVALNILMGLVAGFIFKDTAPLWAIGSWLSILIIFNVFSFQKFRSFWKLYWSHSGKLDIQMVLNHALANGVIWATAFGFLAYFGNISQNLALWSLTLCLMVFASLAMNVLPKGVAYFIAPITIASAAIFTFHGDYHLSAITTAVSAMLSISSVRTARARILYLMARKVLQEKSATVSLLLREFEDSGADWLWQTDTQRHVLHVGPRFAYAMGAEASHIEGMPFLKLIAGDAWERGEYPDELHELADKLKRRESFSNLIVPVTIKSSQRFWELSASPRLSDSGSFLGFRGVGSDVTEQRQSEEKISHLARFDTLTGLPNRLQLTESLGRALAEADKWRRKCGFMMIDLDRFKAVNDTLGHPVGDRLLAQVAQRLEQIMSPNELCARLGGDEFAVVLKDASDANYVSDVARKIIENISKPYTVDQNTLYIGASIGSAVGPLDGRTVELLMRSADLALYHSKDQGGSSHNTYAHKLHASAEERRLMEIELRNALDNEQLHVEYQPLVSSSSDHTLLGFEALLRWKNPKFGNVSPAKFIPVAEDAKLIVPIGEWVLRQACKDAMQWPPSTQVAVNVSVDQLTSSGFVDSVVAALSDTGLPAYRLELEVTESIFLRDANMANRILDRLRGLGIKLSLDDFGTGYSSLSYLKDVHFDTIKIDRSFVQGAAQNKTESLAIIRAVVAMADSMGMATTAEGVETERELGIIQQLGCQKIQGYYFGRPMLFEDASELFRQVGRVQQVA